MSEYPIEITAPDISRHREGNTGIPYVTSFSAEAPGPHVVITALVHGNELSGAWALEKLHEVGIRPARGRLSLAFANVEAYEHFDPADPRATRFLDEDFNRVWDPATLDGPRRSRELTRARALRPLIESADWLLDLHSMQLASPPLLLCGLADKGRRLAKAMAYPADAVADAGHKSGGRMRDHGAFGDPEQAATAMLVEAGQHWARSSVGVAITTCRQFLAATGTVEPALLERLGPPPAEAATRVIEVTEAVTVENGPFRFTRNFTGLDLIAKAGTVIAHDDRAEVRTPYDDCVLVMPSRRLTPGLTAVRLGRIVG